MTGDDLYQLWKRAYESKLDRHDRSSRMARESLVIAAPQFLERYEKERGIKPLHTITVTSRHLHDYVLTNESDGSKWRATLVDGVYQWRRES